MARLRLKQCCVLRHTRAQRGPPKLKVGASGTEKAQVGNRQVARFRYQASTAARTHPNRHAHQHATG
eukprot:6485636-Prymnesium_polylepis.1